MKNIMEAVALKAEEKFIPTPTKEATRAMPGSSEKVEILRQRMQAGEEIWHHDDLDCKAESWRRCLGIVDVEEVFQELAARAEQ